MWQTNAETGLIIYYMMMALVMLGIVLIALPTLVYGTKSKTKS